MYHWRDNLFFGRLPDGSVRIVKMEKETDYSTRFPNVDEELPGAILDVTIPGSQWVSIVASMTSAGESVSHDAVDDLHCPPAEVDSS